MKVQTVLTVSNVSSVYLLFELNARGNECLIKGNKCLIYM